MSDNTVNKMPSALHLLFTAVLNNYSALHLQSSAVHRWTHALKDTSSAVKDNSSAVKDNSSTVKEDSGAVKDNSSAVYSQAVLWRWKARQDQRIPDRSHVVMELCCMLAWE